MSQSQANQMTASDNKLPSLFKLNQELMVLGDAIEAQLGEITVEQEQQLAGLLEANVEKVSNYCLYLDHLESKMEFVKQRIIEAGNYIVNLDKTKERMLSVAKTIIEMRGGQKLEGANGRSISTRKSTSVVVDVEPNMLSSEFVRTKVSFEVDKKAIKAAIEGGKEIEGCSLKEKRSVQWK